MRLPAVWMVTAFAAGILTSLALAAPLLAWIAAALAGIALGLASLFYRRVPLSASLGFALLAWFALGGLAATGEILSVASDNVSGLVREGKLDLSEPLHWRGRLRNDPMRLPWGMRYEIDLEAVEIAGHEIPLSGGLRINYFFHAPEPEILPALRAGERVEALARARLPRNFFDPGAFDMRGYLARQNIDLTGSLRSAELLSCISTPPLTLRSRLARIRGRLLDRVDSLFGGSPEQAAVLRAMLLGDRSFVDSDLAVQFQKTAVYHVLVVAGLHVAALAAFFFWLGRRLRVPLVVTSLVILLALIGYVAVVQNRPPILRAALMAGIALGARLLFRRVDLLHTVALAALVLLVVNPAMLTDTSFELSFLAAGVIAGLALPWIDRSSAPYQRGLEHLGDVTRDRAHAAKIIQLRLDLRAVTQWMEQKLSPGAAARARSLLLVPLRAGIRLWEILVLSFAIQLGMLPLLALDFHRVSLSGPISNVPAVLLTGLIVPLGFVTLGLAWVWNSAAALCAKLTGALVAALLTIIQWLSRWPQLSYRVPGPPAWLVFAFFLALVALVFLARPRLDTSQNYVRRREWLAVAALLVLGTMVATYPFPPRLQTGKLEVTVLDVGQGDSIFAAFPDGHTMLIDGGGQAGSIRAGGYRSGLDIGEEVVSPFLWSRGLKRIDIVALTHAHHDHLDGLRAVLANFRVGELWVGRDVAARPYESLLAEARERGVRVVHRLSGATFSEDGVTGQVFWPEDPTPAAEASNDDSLVLRLEDGAERFLLPGDIEGDVEDTLVRERVPLAADFLKVPHHGSRTSSTDEFLNAVSPRVAAISVGTNNPFGHPAADVLARYAAQGIRLLRTDRDGAITALTDGHSLIVNTYTETHSR